MGVRVHYLKTCYLFMIPSPPPRYWFSGFSNQTLKLKKGRKKNYKELKINNRLFCFLYFFLIQSANPILVNMKFISCLENKGRACCSHVRPSWDLSVRNRDKEVDLLEQIIHCCCWRFYHPLPVYSNLVIKRYLLSSNGQIPSKHSHMDKLTFTWLVPVPSTV